MKKTRRMPWFRIFPAIALVLIGLTACEDQPPTDYVAMPFLEAYLIVGEPIENVVVAVSQPITERFEYARMMAAGAEVVISGDDREFVLQYHEDDGVGSYHFPDSTYRVRPETTYDIQVRMPDGSVLQAETTTPTRIDWMVEPRDVLQYPEDTTQLFSPDSLRIAWTRGNSIEYIIRVTALDTLGYGMYLSPPTEEINSRTNNLQFEDPGDPQFYTKIRWGFIQANQAPTVWAAFRWYGRNEVAILAPDKALLDWFKATQWGGRSVEYREQYSNVRGGLGVFGSATVITKEVFLRKRPAR
ncbi:MAG: DUF4249 family protein [Bacteroidota bacterium]|jgi:hypothetical protein|nr:DUF4249 family protein [Bacteroidota bacterium]